MIVLGEKKSKLFNGFQNDSFNDVNDALYKSFFIYNIILISFTTMFISYIKGLNLLEKNLNNFLIVTFILLPIGYLIVKSIYGLIILQEGYHIFHYQLTIEYSILYIIGYHILLTALFNPIYPFIYIFESILIYLFSILFNKNKIKTYFLTATSFILIYLFIVEKYYLLNFYIGFITYIFMTAITIYFILEQRTYYLVSEEIEILNLGIKNNPDGIVKNFIN